MDDSDKAWINQFTVSKKLTIKELRELVSSESNLPMEIKEDFKRVIEVQDKDTKDNKINEEIPNADGENSKNLRNETKVHCERSKKRNKNENGEVDENLTTEIKLEESS